MKQSEFLSIGTRDFLRGFVMAVLTPVFVIIQQSLDAGILTFNWTSIATASVAGALAYITKNVFTKPDEKTAE